MFDGLEEEFNEPFSLEEINDQEEEYDQDDYINDQLHDEDVEEFEELNSDEDYEEDEEEIEYDEDGNPIEYEEEDEEFDEEFDEEDEPSFSPFIETLEESGLLYLDPDKDYDDSYEGFQEIINDTINAKFSEQLESLSPTARRLLEVEMNGGDINEAFEMFNSFDYSQVNVEDPDIQTELVREYYQAINPRWSDEKITQKIEMLSSTDDLLDEAKDAQEFFVEKTEQEQQAYLERTQMAREEAEQAYYAEMEEYENLIDSNDAFFGLPFSSKKEKEDFKRYVFEVGDDGLTQAQRDDEDKVVRLSKEFHKFKKFNYSDVEKRAKTKAVVDMKKQLSHFGRKAPGTTRSQSKRKDDGSSFSLGDLNFDIG
jgi:hypothetical protein